MSQVEGGTELGASRSDLPQRRGLPKSERWHREVETLLGVPPIMRGMEDMMDGTLEDLATMQLQLDLFFFFFSFWIGKVVHVHVAYNIALRNSWRAFSFICIYCNVEHLKTREAQASTGNHQGHVSETNESHWMTAGRVRCHSPKK